MASALAQGVHLALQLHGATRSALERLRASGAVPAAALAQFWPGVCERFAGGLYKDLLDGNKHLEKKCAPSFLVALSLRIVQCALAADP